MADESNVPVAADATQVNEAQSNAKDAPAGTVVTKAEAPKDGDVATEGEASEEPKIAPTVDEPTEKNVSDDANTDTIKADNDLELSTEAVPTNGTPVSAKKGNVNRRKSVTESKKKTPAKKKAPVSLNLNVEPGELWFVAMRGFPPWPVIVCDEEMLPEALLSKRPVSAKRIDGTYREDFLDGGKNAKDRRYPVMFMGTNEFAWQVNTELQPLDVEEVKKEVEAGNNQKKNKNLWKAYQIAAEGHDLAWFKELLDSHEQAMQVEPEVEETPPVTKKETKKSKRKSQAVEESDDVDLDDADEAGTASVKKAKASKKRKKDAGSDAETEKPAKTPKTTKLTLHAPKDSSAAKSKKEPKAKKTKARESEEAENAKVQEPPMTDAERREKQEKSVLYLRHRLQKGFLSRDQAPKEEEMSNMSDYLKQLETTENLDAEVIKKTKVHKVLKAIVKLDYIPKEEEYNFKKRSSDLLTQWMKVLSADGEPAEAAAAAPPTTNGVNHDTKVGEAKSPAPKPVDEAATKAETDGKDVDGDVSMAEAVGDLPSAKKDAEEVVEAVTSTEPGTA